MKRAVPTTLTGRLVVTTVLLVATAGLLVSFFATLTLRSYLTDRLDDELHASLDRGPRDTPMGGPFGGVPPVGQGEGTVRALLGGTADRGDLIGPGEVVTLSDEVLTVLADVEPGAEPTTVDLPDLGSYRVLATERSDGGTVVGGLPTADVDETITSLVQAELVLTLTGVVGAALVGRVLVRRQLRPLREVAATAHEVAGLPLASGEIDRMARVPDALTDPQTEVGRVGEALNVMLSHVEKAFDERHASEQQVRRFLADASHELRTPLATIAGYAELVRRADESDTDRLRHALAKVESEAARMSTLVADMLLLARLDAGRPLEDAPVDLTRLVVEAVDDARVVDPDRRWTFDVPTDPVEVPGDAGRLHQVVTNLLTNASRHTPPGTAVEVRLRSDGGTARVEVTDDGPGISAELLPTVFDRFTRGDSSRTRGSGGAGLGTSLVRAITEAHGGSVEVTSRPGHTRFTVTLPAHIGESVAE